MRRGAGRRDQFIALWTRQTMVVIVKIYVSGFNCLLCFLNVRSPDRYIVISFSVGRQQSNCTSCKRSNIVLYILPVKFIDNSFKISIRQTIFIEKSLHIHKDCTYHNRPESWSVLVIVRT